VLTGWLAGLAMAAWLLSSLQNPAPTPLRCAPAGAPCTVCVVGGICGQLQVEDCVTVGDIEAPRSHIAHDQRAVVACSRAANRRAGGATLGRQGRAGKIWLGSEVGWTQAQGCRLVLRCQRAGFKPAK
jgi:hypothetical protein